MEIRQGEVHFFEEHIRKTVRYDGKSPELPLLRILGRGQIDRLPEGESSPSLYKIEGPGKGYAARIPCESRLLASLFRFQQIVSERVFVAFIGVDIGDNAVSGKIDIKYFRIYLSDMLRNFLKMICFSIVQYEHCIQRGKVQCQRLNGSCYFLRKMISVKARYLLEVILFAL